MKLLSVLSCPDAIEQDENAEIVVIHRIWSLSAALELGLSEDIPYHLDHSRSVLEAWELRIFWLLLEIASGRLQSVQSAVGRQLAAHTDDAFSKNKTSTPGTYCSENGRCDYGCGEALIEALRTI